MVARAGCSESRVAHRSSTVPRGVARQAWVARALRLSRVRDVASGAFVGAIRLGHRQRRAFHFADASAGFLALGVAAAGPDRKPRDGDRRLVPRGAAVAAIVGAGCAQPDAPGRHVAGAHPDHAVPVVPSNHRRHHLREGRRLRRAGGNRRIDDRVDRLSGQALHRSDRRNIAEADRGGTCDRRVVHEHDRLRRNPAGSVQVHRLFGLRD